MNQLSIPFEIKHIAVIAALNDNSTEEPRTPSAHETKAPRAKSRLDKPTMMGLMGPQVSIIPFTCFYGGRASLWESRGST